jgi:hypothetical protein
MNRRPAKRMPACSVLVASMLLLGLGLLMLPGVGAGVSSSAARGAGLWSAVSPSSGNNASNGGDPSSSSASSLCPASGPTILGIQWNCVAILNLTEVVVILVALGIVAYVFRDSDKAELPGDAAEVPVTPEEELEYRADRKLGVPYHPPEFPRKGEE